jgi:predicted unusual protein kinase regulating ubiquinone biosynthesis (AarF/ABC1/UbiB family)
MERFHGLRVDDPDVLRRVDDPEAELVEGLLAWFRSILEAGFFHGDVHAGNLMFLEDGRIGFLDFGIVGRFDDARRKQAMGFMLSLATRNFKQLAQVVVDMGSVQRSIDLEALAADLEKAYDPLVGKKMMELNYQELVPNIMRASIKHSLKFPQDFVLITKQLLYFDRYARLLAPHLNLFQDPRIFMLLASKLPEFGPRAMGMVMAAMQQAQEARADKEGSMSNEHRVPLLLFSRRRADATWKPSVEHLPAISGGAGQHRPEAANVNPPVAGSQSPAWFWHCPPVGWAVKNHRR